jgi:hypothetical protein
MEALGGFGKDAEESPGPVLTPKEGNQDLGRRTKVAPKDSGKSWSKSL